MSDSPTPQDSGATPGREPVPGTPRWVKVSGAVALALVVAFLLLHLTGSGFGSGMHSGGH
ncbi:hypothetical protein RCO28_29250 [Streptomyces sp. LHD-70]|uniref:hypothetical protein n=1 Tax=Streptomyces sp. LHD-70 TaxID=3072140 RepID=UPI00280DFF93|nr:hypothetical protein [Streptomyces sp. LHD-70]MDQ8706529.1 hypothetical protein [Streptomyces sp. LHD-70]